MVLSRSGHGLGSAREMRARLRAIVALGGPGLGGPKQGARGKGLEVTRMVLLRFTLALLVVALGLGTASCDSKTKPKPVLVAETAPAVSYLKDVAPIFDARCAVCHSCYDAPCQLKLNSYEGTSRGGSKIQVYDDRLSAIAPTRLFLDAFSTEEWRKKGFFSVTANTAENAAGNTARDAGKVANNSTMLELLNLKRQNPEVKGTFNAASDELSCPANPGELATFMTKHPNRGMPFGFPGLNAAEFETIANWLEQGAKGPTEAEQKALEARSPLAEAQIAKLEAFLNETDAKHVMTARYLYEHFFLAQINFGKDSNEFYQLVRSRTPSPEPVEIVDTPLPYDAPGVKKFYYRFRKIISTIVHKTHIVFTLDETKFKRIEKIFIEPKWDQAPHVMSYDPVVSANPFAVFEQIPPKSRYEFLLDNSNYILMTFIRGPVCRGNIALNVIQDHFWVMFMDPKYDLSVTEPGYLSSQIGNLRMPIVRGVDPSLVDLVEYPYNGFAVSYYSARQKLYAKHYAKGLGYEAIWRGYVADNAPIQTVYRHYNSATVRKGVLGNLPRTLWVVDYPIFERIYYDLVAGFDVFSDVTSQINIRRYMNWLRIEGETNFLDFMPKADRKPMFSSWYGVTDGIEIVKWMPTKMPTAIPFRTDDPKREMATEVVEKVVLPSTNIHFDPINYFRAGQKPPPMPKSFASTADFIQGIRAIKQPGIRLLEVVDGGNSNLAFIRIRFPDGTSQAFTFVVNRWHTNVAFMFFEKGRLVPAKDTFNIIPGFLGSYPNFLFDIHIDDMPDFFRLLTNFQAKKPDVERLLKYGLARSDPDFWKQFDWMQAAFLKQQPIEGGLFDLTEYHYQSFR